MKNTMVGDIPLKILVNAKSKSIKLRLSKEGEAVVVLPKWTPKLMGISFAQKNLDWLKTQKEKLGTPHQFENGARIDLLGTSYMIEHNPHTRGGVFIQDGKIIVTGEIEYLHRRVRDFVKKQAYDYIQQKAIMLAAQLGEKPSKITLRDTSSRWGSCSSNKSLSFCWKLALAPTYVLDYIIAHEVAHLVQMNHSDAFWAVVAKIDNNRATAGIWLRKNGATLQRWI